MKLQRIIIAASIFACLFILLFPPLRSPDEYYSHLKIVDGQSTALSVSRFSDFGGMAMTQEHGFLRVEVDAGELLRELALIVVFSTASHLWLPTLIAAMRLESNSTKLASSPKT